MDKADVGLSSPIFAADGQRYSVAGRDSAAFVIEAQEPQSRSSKVVNCTFLGEICGEIEVAKVFRSNI